MYNKEAFERICSVKCYDKELINFCKDLEKHEYDLDNPFEKYYSLDSILLAIKLYRQGRVSDKYLSHWACAYLWILVAQHNTDEYFDTFKVIPKKEIIIHQIIDYLDSLSFYDDDYDGETDVETRAEIFTDLDEVYRTVDQWEAYNAPDDDLDPEYAYGHSWVLFVNRGTRKFLRVYNDSFDCKEDSLEGTRLTLDQLKAMETELISQGYAKLNGLLGYDTLFEENEESQRLFDPREFNDEMRLLYGRICDLTCSIDDLHDFNYLEPDWEESTDGRIKNYSTPYDLDSPFKKYYNPTTVIKALDMYEKREISRDFLEEWLKAYSQILQAQIVNSIFLISKSRKKTKLLIPKNEAIEYTIAEHILSMSHMLSSKSSSRLKSAREDFLTYNAIYRSINDWQVAYSPISEGFEDDGYCHKVLFFNDRIRQFAVVYPEIGSESECYYEGLCCDKYDFMKICDNLRKRKYKEIFKK